MIQSCGSMGSVLQDVTTRLPYVRQICLYHFNPTKHGQYAYFRDIKFIFLSSIRRPSVHSNVLMRGSSRVPIPAGGGTPLSPNWRLLSFRIFRMFGSSYLSEFQNEGGSNFSEFWTFILKMHLNY